MATACQTSKKKLLTTLNGKSMSSPENKELKDSIEAIMEDIAVLRYLNKKPKTPSSAKVDPDAIVNHSGGANGADTVWADIGKEYGVITNAYWHKEVTPTGNTEITKEDAVEGQKKVTIAAREMGRIEPTHQVRDQKLIRNWSQVKYSDQIIAITTMLSVGGIMNYGKKARIRQGKGGTGYAIQMAINEGKPVYVFDQVREQWFENTDGKWKKSTAPKVSKNFAGIGSQKINAAGVQAIREVYSQSFAEDNKPEPTPLNVDTELEVLPSRLKGKSQKSMLQDFTDKNGNTFKAVVYTMLNGMQIAVEKGTKDGNYVYEYSSGMTIGGVTTGSLESKIAQAITAISKIGVNKATDTIAKNKIDGREKADKTYGAADAELAKVSMEEAKLNLDTDIMQKIKNACKGKK